MKFYKYDSILPLNYFENPFISRFFTNKIGKQQNFCVILSFSGNSVGRLRAFGGKKSIYGRGPDHTGQSESE